MRPYSHVTPRYVFDRVGEMIAQRLDPKSPWLTKKMVEILDTKLKPTDRGLEWGSGRSTVWFAKRVAHLTSVEHNAEWAETVKDQLETEGLADRVALHLLSYGPSEEDQAAGASAYVKIAEGLAPEALDFCLVDGSCRDSCAWAGLPILKSGGLLIIDDAERYLPRQTKSRAPNARGLEDGYASETWGRFADAVSDWPCTWTTNGVSDTALWIKP